MMNQDDLVYICSPLSAPTEEGIRENMYKARMYMEQMSALLGCRTIAPHAFLPEYLDDNIPEERRIGLQFGLSLLEICKGIVICGNIISNGMKAEIERAKELDMPIMNYQGELSSRDKV